MLTGDVSCRPEVKEESPKARVEAKPPTTPPPPPSVEAKPAPPKPPTPPKLTVSPEEALDLVNPAMTLLKAPLVASLDLKPTWTIEDLLSFFVVSSSKFRDYNYVIATLRSNGDLDVSILLDQDGGIVAWRGFVGGREYDISERIKLITLLPAFYGK